MRRREPSPAELARAGIRLIKAQLLRAICDYLDAEYIRWHRLNSGLAVIAGARGKRKVMRDRQAVGLFGPWNIDCDGYIRNQDGCCPLGALLVARGYRQHKLPTAFDAARLLSLDCAYDLIWAADVPGTRLRSRLLVACGLRGAES